MKIRSILVLPQRSSALLHPPGQARCTMPPGRTTRLPSPGYSMLGRTSTRRTSAPPPRLYTWRPRTAESERWRGLLAAGADRNAKAMLNTTPLHHAAQGGHAEAIAILVSAGANPNARAVLDTTPLHHAAESGHVDAIAALAAAGADPNARAMPDEPDATYAAVRVAVGSYSTGSTWWQHRASPLHFAAWEGHDAAISALHSAGADVMARANNGYTALHLAAMYGHPGAVSALLAAGAEMNAGNSFGWTPLHGAAWNNRGAAIATLADAGANVNAKDDNGATPLHEGARAGSRDAIAALAAAGLRSTRRITSATPPSRRSEGGPR